MPHFNLIESIRANAATVYQDRIVPTSKPCMVSFNGTTINAMIEEISVGDFNKIVY